MHDATGIGAPLRRREDPRLLTGAARFTDDIVLPGQVHAALVRSPHAHARIGGIDAREARQAPGVLLVWGAADLRREGVRPLPSLSATPPFDVRGRDGQPAPEADQYPLAEGTARYAGEPVALVVATTAEAARDAAERVAVDYEPLAPAVTLEGALAAGAPRVWPDRPSNLSIDREQGDAARVDAAFARAAGVARVDLASPRIAPAFLEPRAAIADFDAATGRWTLRAGCQSPHGMQALLAGMLGVESGRLRVIVPDMGGGFGARGIPYPEYPLLLAAARRVGRPVRWTADRTEALRSDTQARDERLRGELAIDEVGRFTAMRVHVDWRHGAYLTSRSVWVMAHYLPPTLGGPYRIPCAHVRLRGVFTHTTPVAAYRGVGRMEASYLTECLVEEAARVTGLDPVEIRRRNLVTRSEMPWTTPCGAVVTSGEFAGLLDRALALADRDGFPARRQAAARAGRRRGLGVGLYVENDGSTPTEYAAVEATADGRVVVRVGTQDFGMGHETVFAQVASDALGVPGERVHVLFGDTDAVARGSGSHGSRSARMGGGAVVHGARALVEAGRALAAAVLEAAPADLVYGAGRFAVAGTDRGVGLFEVAAAAEARGTRLAGEADFVTAGDVHASGCHVCEVSLDPETGAVRLARHVVVADVGRAINPRIVEGQLHGGTAQGVGQALLERVVFDEASGQPLSGSLLDYALPRADDLPSFAVELAGIVEPDNPLGVKGVGESGATGAPAALMAAIRDALGGAGGAAVDMPATPERVHRALGDARP